MKLLSPKQFHLLKMILFRSVKASEATELDNRTLYSLFMRGYINYHPRKDKLSVTLEGRTAYRIYFDADIRRKKVTHLSPSMRRVYNLDTVLVRKHAS